MSKRDNQTYSFRKLDTGQFLLTWIDGHVANPLDAMHEEAFGNIDDLFSRIAEIYDVDLEEEVDDEIDLDLDDEDEELNEGEDE